MTSTRFTVSIPSLSLTWAAFRHTQIAFRVLDPSVTRVASVRFYHKWSSSQICFNSISIRQNRYVLPFRRFISGVRRWSFRFLTDEYPPTRWYGGFTWVFDPGIHGVNTLLDGLETIRNRIGDLVHVSSCMVFKKQWWKEVRNDNPKDICLWIQSRRTEIRLRKLSWKNGFQFASKTSESFRDQIGHINQGINTGMIAFPMTLIVDYIQEAATTNRLFLVMVSLNPQKQNLQTLTPQMPHWSAVGDDDVECVVIRNTPQFVLSTKLLLRGGLWSSLVSFRHLSKFGKKLFLKDATIEITTMVKLFVIMLKKITESIYFRKTLVRKPWYHYVYISELCLDTSGLQLRFAKKFSHKMVHANRNREKSNMKLDNNGSYDELASKTTLRKASSISLLLYFS